MSNLTRLALEILEDPAFAPGLKSVACTALLKGLRPGCMIAGPLELRDRGAIRHHLHCAAAGAAMPAGADLNQTRFWTWEGPGFALSFEAMRRP